MLSTVEPSSPTHGYLRFKSHALYCGTHTLLKQDEGRVTDPISLWKEFTTRNAKATEESRAPVNCFPPTHTRRWLACRRMPISRRVVVLLGVAVMEKPVQLQHPSDTLLHDCPLLRVLFPFGNTEKETPQTGISSLVRST